MGLNAKKVAHTGGSKGPAQEPIEPGTYPVRVAQIIDLGLQPQRPYQGQEKPPAYEIMMTYEFLDEFCLDEDGNAEGELYEDAGEGWEFKDGQYLLTKYTASTVGDKVVVKIDSEEGSLARPDREVMVEIVTDSGVIKGSGREREIRRGSRSAAAAQARASSPAIRAAKLHDQSRLLPNGSGARITRPSRP